MFMNHIHDHKCLFVYMNTSISTFCGSKLARFVSTMFPALLKTRSTGALVAGIQNNVRTPISRAGYQFILLRHQTSGSSRKLSTIGSSRKHENWLATSALTFSYVFVLSPVSPELWPAFRD